MIAVPWFKFPWSTATADLAHALALAALDGDTEAKGQLDEIEAQARRGNKAAVEAWRYFSAIVRLAAAGEPPPSVLLQLRGVKIGAVTRPQALAARQRGLHLGDLRRHAVRTPATRSAALQSLLRRNARPLGSPARALPSPRALPSRAHAVVGLNGGFPGAVPMLPWGYQSIWNYGVDPFVFEEMQADAELGQLPAGFTPMYNPPSWPSAVGEPLPGEVEYEYEVGQFPMGAPGGVPLLPFGFGPFNYGGGGDGYFRSGPGMSEDIELEDRYI